MSEHLTTAPGTRIVTPVPFYEWHAVVSVCATDGTLRHWNSEVQASCAADAVRFAVEGYDAESVVGVEVDRG